MTEVASSAPLRRLLRATATGVLGEYEHRVDFRDAGDMAIIYGPNGVGKTRFLEIIDALSNLRIGLLDTLPFESAMLQFTDGWALTVSHEKVFPDDEDQWSKVDAQLIELMQTMTKHRGEEHQSEPIRALQFQLLGPLGDV